MYAHRNVKKGTSISLCTRAPCCRYKDVPFACSGSNSGCMYGGGAVTAGFHRTGTLAMRRYKFAIVFTRENGFRKDLLDEKIVNPLLAGAIPVYSGQS